MNGFHLTEERKTHVDCETDLNKNYSALSCFGEIYLKVYINQPVWQALLREEKGKSDARANCVEPCFSRVPDSLSPPLFIAPDTQAT